MLILHLTNDCGILKLLEPSEEVMADRVFEIENDLPPGVSLNIPLRGEGVTSEIFTIVHKITLSIQVSQISMSLIVAIYNDMKFRILKRTRIVYRILPFTK